MLEVFNQQHYSIIIKPTRKKLLKIRTVGIQIPCQITRLFIRVGHRSLAIRALNYGAKGQQFESSPTLTYFFNVWMVSRDSLNSLEVILSSKKNKDLLADRCDPWSSMPAHHYLQTMTCQYSGLRCIQYLDPSCKFCLFLAYNLNLPF